MCISKLTDRIKSIWKHAVASFVRGLLMVHFYMIFRPKLYYTCEEAKKKKFSRPTIVICNHISFIDGPFIGSIFRKNRVHFLTARDVYRGRGKNWLMRQCRCISIDRYGLDTSWVHSCKDILKNDSISIFPEGKTTKSAEMQEFKSGFVLLAMISGAQILPVCIDGSYKMYFGERQRILIGTPMTLEKPDGAPSRDYIDRETKRFETLIHQMQQQLRDMYKK